MEYQVTDCYPRAKTDDAEATEEAETAAPVDKGKGKSTAAPEEPEEEEDDDDSDDSDDELIVRGTRRRKQVDYSSVSGQWACLFGQDEGVISAGSVHPPLVVGVLSQCVAFTASCPSYPPLFPALGSHTFPGRGSRRCRPPERRRR